MCSNRFADRRKQTIHCWRGLKPARASQVRSQKRIMRSRAHKPKNELLSLEKLELLMNQIHNRDKHWLFGRSVYANDRWLRHGLIKTEATRHRNFLSLSLSLAKILRRGHFHLRHGCLLDLPPNIGGRLP